MKILNLNQYDEKFGIRKMSIDDVDPYIYHPKTKQELKRIINDIMKKEGPECDLNFIDTSKITDMSNLFKTESSFKSDLSKWDVSNVEYMIGMFMLASSFNSDLSKWDVSKVEDMGFMFNKAFSFNSHLSRWDVSNVKYMDDMFNDCPALKPQWYKVL